MAEPIVWTTEMLAARAFYYRDLHDCTGESYAEINCGLNHLVVSSCSTGCYLEVRDGFPRLHTEENSTDGTT